MFRRHRAFVEAFGWYGVIAVVLAYAMHNVGVWTARDIPYVFLNISGGIGLMINNWMHKAYQSMSVNIVWIVVGSYAFWNIITGA